MYGKELKPNYLQNVQNAIEINQSYSVVSRNDISKGVDEFRL